MSTRCRPRRRRTRLSSRTRIFSSTATSSAAVSISSSPRTIASSCSPTTSRATSSAAGFGRWRLSHRQDRRCAGRPCSVGAGRRQRQRRPRSSATSPSCPARATAVRNGVSIILNQGDNVYQGDVVQSGSSSTLGITFIDGSVFGLASNAKMVLNEMIYDPNGSNNSSLLSLVSGHHLLRGRRHRQARRHEGRYAGRDHGHPRHRHAGGNRFRDSAAAEPAAGSAGVRRSGSRCWSSPTAPAAPTVLLDRVTLAPIATVNQPGTTTTVSGQGTVTFLPTRDTVARCATHHQRSVRAEVHGQHQSED